MTNFHNPVLYIFSIISVTAFLLFDTRITNAECSNVISGKFINKTFLDQTAEKIPGNIPVYCFQMNFYSPDSVDISFGFEKANYAYKKVGENFSIVNAYQGKDMLFILNPDNSITLIDSVWTGIPSNSLFVNVNSDDPWAFDIYLNNKMIAGEYFYYREDKFTGKRITFHPDGLITGMEGFNRYSICYSGDCIGETKTPSNIVYLINSDGAESVYAFTKNKDDGALSIYELGPQIKDIKGERTIEGKVFDLRK